MSVALAVSAVVVVVLVVVVVRLRGRVDELQGVLAGVRGERDAVAEDRDASTARADGLEQERDDALDRVTRSRRDAAEVANRLRDETAARSEIEAELSQAKQVIIDVQQVLEELRARERAAPDPDADDLTSAELLWALLLRQVEHTWRLSIALGPDDVSPLVDAADPLHAAIEIEVDAAREEGGADVDLTWHGDGSASASASALAHSLVRDVIAALGTTAARTSITVTVDDDSIEVAVDATGDDGEAIEVDLPADVMVAPGRARLS